MGCHFSVNHRMLEYDQGLALVRSLPEDRLLTETDSPFTSQGGRKSTPADVLATTQRLAEIRGVSITQMQTTLTVNAKRVLGFASVAI